MSDRPTSRLVARLDGTWHFVRDPDELLQADRLPEGMPVSVPGCWEAQIPEPFGVVHAWYWRDFEVPTAWPHDGALIARFGAVMYRCEVWLNGRPVADHEGGYTPFDVSLDAAARDRPNRLALRITNPMNAITEYPALSDERLDRAERRVPELPIREIPHGKQTWYASQSGPWRSVSLERRPSQSIARLRAGADWASGRVRVRADLVGEAGGTLELAVRGPDGELVADASVTAGATIETTLEVPDWQAWEIAASYLYRLDAQLRIGGSIVDEAGTRFGFREIHTDHGRIVLNGRPVLLRGALDQDLYADTISTPPSREFLDRQLRLAREMGLNLLRCHIKLPDPEYLDAADEAGMLLWCELPNWLRLTPAAARRGEALLEDMVEAAGDHPSVVIWTIINEDWGTDLRHSARDRAWLRQMAQRLRALDPTRLVVDNSPCPTATGPNFHLDTDIADFHRYAAMPDAMLRWRAQMAELAERPAWLWSPHGDAVHHGDEPVVVSEFGSWGLPDPSRLDGAWWSQTGDGPTRPSGIARRFAMQRLERVWPDVRALAAATRHLQVEALQYQVGEIRRHAGLAGMVVTEFTDAFWEANGLLTVDRTLKLDHERVAEFFGEAALIVDLPRRDLWTGEQVTASVTISAERAGQGGMLRWRLGSASGSQPVGGWAECIPTPLAALNVTAPGVAVTTDADLVVELVDAEGSPIARATVLCAIVPARLRRAGHPRRLSVTDPLGGGGLSERLEAAGHYLVDASAASLIVTTHLAAADLGAVNRGARLLLLARSADALPDELALDRPVRLQPRWPDRDRPRSDFTWTGDWIGAFSWILPELSADLPRRAPLDFAYEAVLPDHVIRGYEPAEHADEVAAGIFVGWVHAPVALLWRFPQGRGRLTLTTLHVAPEDGPTASVLREALLRWATG